VDKQVLIIAEQELAPGFQMAGAEVVWPTQEADPEQLLKQALESDQWGLVLVDEEFYASLGQKIREMAFESVSPVVMFVNLSLSSSQSPEQQIAEIVRQAIGYSLKIREE